MKSSSDIITLPGLSSVTETMDRLKKVMTNHGITIYAHIDQQAEAIKSGLSLKPLELLIFGNPKGGIPLMRANPLCGLDLPLKILVWEDDEQKVWLGYNSFAYLEKRFELPAALIQNISGVEKIIQQAMSSA
jgi:uncharacterized protein (DUF302 family)